jgi:hypothetical protein
MASLISRPLIVAVGALALAAPSIGQAKPLPPEDPAVYVQPRELAPVEEQFAARTGISRQEAQVLASRGVGAPAPATHSGAPRAQATATGFDLDSAAIGAGAIGGLVLVAAGGVAAAHRTRIRPAR